MMTHQPIRVNITIGKNTYTTEMLATELDSALAEEKKSILRWAKIKDSRKAALSILVSKLLGTMNDTIGDWLPSAIKAKTPTLVEVSFKLFLSDIDIVVAELEYQEQLRQDRAIESLSEILDGNQSR
jgi:hypothetical protein